MTANDLAARYKETVQLPNTAFPMKASLSQSEPARVQNWKTAQIYQKMVAQNQGKKRFVMPDGPPYANGNIHVGTALNKILKDFIIKYRNLKGEEAPFIPGWDCHGLPIELNITKKLGAKRATTSDVEIRRLCREEAKNWVNTHREQFSRLGVLADWDNPYLTLDPTYEADEIRVLADINDRGVFYRGDKPVYWDPALQTALAAAEVEYQTHKSPSVYVRFAFSPEAQTQLDLQKPTSIVIWTTTPWTLPANYGIAVHPEFEYGVFDSRDGLLVLACELKDAFTKATGITLTEVKTFKGAKLERLNAVHPFLPRSSLIVLGEHVTLETGTGCVHTAPGHGVDDYVVGQKYGLPVKSPVDEAGKFTADVPDLQGVNVWEGNKLIIEKLKSSGHLLAVQEIEHQYPYGPRSKKPLIFRATPQWFIRLDDEKFNVRRQTLALIEKSIRFVPPWGVQRLNAMVGNSPDWCLSRQRIWGVPVPVFYCEKCQTPLIQSEVMRRLADTMEKSGEGIEAYFSHPESEFTAGHHCGKCGAGEFKRGRDILDVWFDSGVCHRAVQRRNPKLGFPADIYIEGSDQHRGWFQTSLISSVAASGEAPYRALVTHGFVNDAKGLKMSKSVGNVVDPADVIKESGAEILRLWAAHEDFGDDLTISKEMLTRITDTYRRFRNTIRFILGNLNDFNPDKDKLTYADLHTLDRWALHELNDLITECNVAYDNFEFYKVYHGLNRFFTTDLSATYLDVLKDRLYTSRANGKLRRSSQTVLFEIGSALCGLLAPITSFLAEETYQYLPGEKQESIFLKPFPQPTLAWKDSALADQFKSLLEVRTECAKVLEDLRRQKVIGSSLDATVTIEANGAQLTALQSYQGQLRELFIVSEIKFSPGPALKIHAGQAPGEKCVRCWHYSLEIGSTQEFPGVCPKCVEALK
jgi:isoleucyl-tRNA synthetase